MRVHYVLLVLVILSFELTTAAQTEPVTIPTEVKPFVTPGMVPIALKTGDLNGDGTKDFILVLDKPFDDKAQYDEAGESERPALILIRDASGKLSLAAQNDLAVYCRACGGVLGDPFARLVIPGTFFTIDNYGGSSDRWTEESTFAYSRRDRQWQLTRIEETAFNTFTPTKVCKWVYTRPKTSALSASPTSTLRTLKERESDNIP
ncbi:MAG TPA: hypothetical protein VEV84_14085 [Pyrinomonadaceae bacterium]|nr:hypothetical protein [Pyrinomonadaceae bacterium]